MNAPISWKESFQAALTESDLQQLPERIQRARATIMDRVEQLLDDPEHEPEQDDILRALNRLHDLEARLGTVGLRS